MLRFEKVTPRLPVADLSRAVRFYADVLGFRVEMLWPDAAPTFAILERDAVAVQFFLPDEHHPQAPGNVTLCLEVGEETALHRQLAAGGVAVEWGPEVYSYGRREFAIRDPDGCLLIFTEQTADPSTCQVE
jgi:catechol 2,3-dioxygenase-like lactoylglutathione lyase family enzyme